MKEIKYLFFKRMDNWVAQWGMVQENVPGQMEQLMKVIGSKGKY